MERNSISKAWKENIILFIMMIFSIVSGFAQIGEVIWEENFNDLDNWNISTGNGSWGWGNGELEFYQGDNVEITAIPGEANNMVDNKHHPDPRKYWQHPVDFPVRSLLRKKRLHWPLPPG